MLICLRVLDPYLLVLLSVIFWRVWYYRNQLVHNVEKEGYGDVVRWVTTFIEEWNSTHLVDKPCPALVSVAHGWRPPEGGVWKINSNAATDYARKVIGFGIIIRDKSGKVFSTAAIKVRAMFSPLIAEAMAVWRGVSLALDFGLVPFQIESDCLQVIDLVNKGVPSSADVGPIISLIFDSLNSTPGCSISHTPRTGNLVAHNLVKFALSIERDCCWLDSCPPCVERLVQIDAFG
ncbi:hypothetical protein LWI29_022499 [Acer saccharum]|uniref:RNase H type-1 domain-containing protein n=1 Tax=Acer saccharum TaxID=4024 RepID=A0AA39S6C2_ACESA|nr:hypothetical protein LWI29_022499 [Acer saccharum]